MSRYSEIEVQRILVKVRDCICKKEKDLKMFKIGVAILIAVIGLVNGDGWHGVCPQVKTIQKLTLKDVRA